LSRKQLAGFGLLPDLAGQAAGRSAGLFQGPFLPNNVYLENSMRHLPLITLFLWCLTIALYLYIHGPSCISHHKG
jgi:hypothetical protein